MKFIANMGAECAAFFDEFIDLDRKVLCIATLGFNDVCLHLCPFHVRSHISSFQLPLLFSLDAHSWRRKKVTAFVGQVFVGSNPPQL